MRRVVPTRAARNDISTATQYSGITTTTPAITRAEASVRTLAGRTLTAAGNTTTNNHYHASPINVQASVRSDEDVRALANRLARLAAGQNYGLR